MHLRPARQPRSYDVAVDVERNLALVPFRKRYRLRVRSDPAHVAPEDIDDLRQFVETILAQKPPQPSNPLVVCGGVIPSTMIMRHRPQFKDGERPAAVTRASLTIKNRPRRVELDENCADAEYRGNDGQGKQRDQKIDGALELRIDQRRNHRT